jgi:hypothetical protein
MEIIEVMYELRRRRCIFLDSLGFIYGTDIRAKVLNNFYESARTEDKKIKKFFTYRRD